MQTNIPSMIHVVMSDTNQTCPYCLYRTCPVVPSLRNAMLHFNSLSPAPIRTIPSVYHCECSHVLQCTVAIAHLNLRVECVASSHETDSEIKPQTFMRYPHYKNRHPMLRPVEITAQLNIPTQTRSGGADPRKLSSSPYPSRLSD